MGHRFTSLLVFVVMLCGWSLAADNEDQVALAKDAERSMHRAVDARASAKAAGKPTTQPAGEIQGFYFLYMQHVSKTHYIPNAAVLVPNEIASAGLLKEGNHEMSYLAGAGQSGVVMSAFERTEWTKDTLPGQGFLCSLGIEPPELTKSFKVVSGEWSGGNKRLLKLRYLLDGKSGVIEVRRDEKGWAMYPDRGIVKPGGWRAPYAEVPATRPAE